MKQKINYKLIKENNNSNLNYRLKSYYEYEQIENVKYFNKMFNYIYIFFY